MEVRQVGVLSAAIGLAGVVTQHFPSYLLDQWIQGGPEGRVPMIGSAGQTVVVYNLLFGAIGPLVTVLLAVWLGYRVGDRLDLPAEYRRFGTGVAGGTLASALLAWMAMTLVGGVPSLASIQILVTLAVLVRLVVSVSLVVAVGVFAGAALSHFRTGEEPPGRKSEGAPGRSTGADATVRDL
jgi:hypothetical protein